MTGIDNLPEEVLILIFSLLPPSDLKKVVLVSKQWMVVGETPSLWTWATVSVKCKEDLQKLKNRRIQQMNLQKVQVTNLFKVFNDFSAAVRPEELFNALLPITTLTSIDGLNNDETFKLGSPMSPDRPDLSNIEPELFATVLSRLPCLCFDILNHSPPGPQYDALLSSIAQKNSVKKLVFGWCKMPSQPDLFVAAVCNVEECDFGLFSVPAQDIQALVVAIAQGQGNLKKLSVYSFRLSNIDPDILGTAISRLESAYVHQMLVPLSKNQLAAIVSKASEDGSKLKKLEITGITEEQKGEMDPNLLRQAGLKIGVIEWRTGQALLQDPAFIIDVKYALTIRERA